MTGERDYRRILFIKPSSLGDVVHAMPTLAALHRRFPRASFTWLVKRQWAGIVERMEGVDDICAVRPGLAGWLSQVPHLRAQGFDVAVDLQGLFRSGAMAWLASAPARIGFANAREGSPCFYTQRVAVPTSDMHAVDRYLLVAQALGAPALGEPEFRFRPLHDDRSLVADLLGRHGLSAGEHWIAMNVSARWATKRWPRESFAAVADRLQGEGLG
ncbi:MAG: glycosyltransferase family 9 protein, partial [Nitrospiraceae bacterium]